MNPNPASYIKDDQVVASLKSFVSLRFYNCTCIVSRTGKSPVKQSKTHTKQIRLTFFFRVTTSETGMKLGARFYIILQISFSAFPLHVLPIIPICFHMFPTIPGELCLCTL